MAVLTVPGSMGITMQDSQASVSRGLIALVRAWQTFSVKGQRVDIFGIAGHVGPVTNTQLCPRNTRQLLIIHEQLGRAVFYKTIY